MNFIDVGFEFLDVAAIDRKILFFRRTSAYQIQRIFLVRHKANARAGTEVRCNGVPTPHLCPRITDKTLPTDDDMMIPKNNDSTF